MIVLKKIWDLIVKYWKVLLGFFLALGGFIAVSKVFEKPPDDNQLAKDIEDNSKELLDAVVRANVARDRRLVELAKQHQEKVKKLNEDQQKELKELSNKSLEEVVEWFDKL